MNDKIADNPADKPEKQKKSGIGRKIFRFILGVIFVIFLGLAFLTMRVNQQRAKVEEIQKAGGNVAYKIEFDQNNNCLLYTSDAADE